MPASRTVKIAGSILGGDLLNLESAIRMCEAAGADLIQMDICDGRFVPTISFGEAMVKRTSASTKLPVVVHLMVTRPEDWVARLADCGQCRIIFHYEASTRSMDLVQSIQRAVFTAGVA